MYTLGIALYALIAKLSTPFNAKAKKMLRGHKDCFPLLASQIEKGERYIWFHAASLGEFEQGRPLMEKIKAEQAGYKIVLTFFSPSGYEVRKNYEGADIVCYLPFDLPGNVQRFLDLVNPSMAVFIKYEFWKNYLTALQKRGIPTYIISAIFRPKQVFFRWYARSYQAVLHTFTTLFVQDEASLQLLKKHHIKPVVCCGDTRFDRVVSIQAQAKELPILETFVQKNDKEKHPTLVIGSSWPVDEEKLLPYFNKNKSLKLIIAPHEIHSQHLEEIIGQLKRPYVLYTEATEENVREADCVIMNCFGLLSSTYRYGRLAYIGGGFGVGIHNILEAAVYGIPVLFGPNYHKFKEAKDLLEAQGAFCVQSKEDLEAQLQRFFTSKKDLEEASQRAGEYVQNNQGATNVIYQHLFGA